MAASEGHSNSRHLSVALAYAGPPPVVDSADWPGHGANFSCDFEGRDGSPVGDEAAGCPFLRNEGANSALADRAPPLGHPRVSSPPATATATAAAYEHCYTINGASGFDLAWTLRRERAGRGAGARAWLDVQASARVAGPGTWVALGFRPMSREADQGAMDPLGTGRGNNFGMEGADIVAGFGSGEVRPLYAALYTGPPQAPDPPSSALEIFNASASFEADAGGGGGGGVLTLRFTRAAAGSGHLASLGLPDSQTTILSPRADILWAVGAAADDDEGFSASCAYHENTRGLRVVDWEDPTRNFVDIWKCADTH